MSTASHIHIAPSRTWQLLDLPELWQYRELLGVLVWKELKIRYKQTLIGIAWAVLQPLLMTVMLTLVFSRFTRGDFGRIPYPLFACCGLLPWQLFAQGLN